MTIALRRPTAPYGYATIAMSDYRSAQGPILRQFLDGRVMIDTGDSRLTGWPLSADPVLMPVRMPVFGNLF
ncbi:MAG: hypothetical protein ACK5IP_09880 [Paracoccus sp. (in: a-proteobacteria)]